MRSTPSLLLVALLLLVAARALADESADRAEAAATRAEAAATRPETAATRTAPGPEATRVDGGALVGRILGEQQVRHLFTVNGGHIWPILAHLREHGVEMIHMRHEQSCAYAADAYARSTGRPGVLAVTAGCGLTNAVTGLCVAGLTGSPVVCLAGQHPTTEDQLGSFQEAYGADICRTFSK